MATKQTDAVASKDPQQGKATTTVEPPTPEEVTAAPNIPTPVAVTLPALMGDLVMRVLQDRTQMQAARQTLAGWYLDNKPSDPEKRKQYAQQFRRDMEAMKQIGEGFYILSAGMAGPES